MIKVLGINGSPRSKGNTGILVRNVLAGLEEQGITTEYIQLGGKKAGGCTACYKCRDAKDGQCHGRNDFINDCIDKTLSSDGVVLGSPVYFTDITAEMKAYIDRAGLVALVNGGLLKRKVGAAVIAVRRGGALHSFDSINHFFLINQMIVPGSNYWNFVFGRNPGEVESDDEGLNTMSVLADNMGWLLKLIDKNK